MFLSCIFIHIKTVWMESKAHLQIWTVPSNDSLWKFQQWICRAVSEHCFKSRPAYSCTEAGFPWGHVTSQVWYDDPSSSSTPTRFRSLKRTTRWTESRSARFPWEGLIDRVGDLTGTPQGHGVAHSVGLSRAVGWPGAIEAASAA